jgi:signal transduction histidine kinase
MSVKAGQGSLSVLPARRARWLAILAALWIVLVLTLGGWWVTYFVRQARLVAELQQLVGRSDVQVVDQWARTRLMLVGESSVFLVLLLLVSGLLAWFYLREARRARGMQAFFAAVTHELRTPLTSIRLQAEAIAEGDQRVELARRLLEDSSRLESQIDKTLELARIEGGGPLAEQSVPLHGWLERTLAQVAASQGGRVTLLVQVPEGLPPVLVDAAALQMVLRNLVENAVRHAGREPVQVQVSARALERFVVLQFRDDGAGTHTPARELGRLFGRGSGSAGSGVGLYLVRALIERMGGSVEFCTAPGDGFTAELRLLASSEAE